MLYTDRLGWSVRALPGLVALAVVLLLLTAGRALAAAPITVCPSGCDYARVTEAIAAVDSGGTVQIRAGTYEGGVAIDKTLRLQGAGASQTIIGGGVPAVAVASGVQVTMQGLAVVGDSQGVVNEGALTLQETAVRTTLNGYLGGAGILNTGTLTVRHSTISGSRATGIRTDGGVVTVTDSVISHNATGSQLYGGGLAIGGGSVTVSDSTISDNFAGVGGGIATGGILVVRGSTISGNTAFYCGGGIATSGATTILDTLVTGNSALVFGGAGIARFSGELTLRDSTVTGNSGKGPDIADVVIC